MEADLINRQARPRWLLVSTGKLGTIMTSETSLAKRSSSRLTILQEAIFSAEMITRRDTNPTTNPTGIDFSFDELSGKPEPVQRGFAAVSTFVTGVLRRWQPRVCQ